MMTTIKPKSEITEIASEIASDIASVQSRSKDDKHYISMQPTAVTQPPFDLSGAVPQSTSFQIDLLDIISQHRISKGFHGQIITLLKKRFNGSSNQFQPITFKREHNSFNN